MKKNLLLSTLISASLLLNAQTQSGNVSSFSNNPSYQNTPNDQGTGFQRGNLRFGGTFGLMFGDITIIDISPTVGYQFTPMFQLGVGVIYNYYSERLLDGRKFSMSAIGGNSYVQFSPIKFFFLRAEYGILNQEVDFWGNRRNEWVQYPLVGGGVFMPIGQSGGLSASLLWNLNDTDWSVYGQNPIFRIGVVFGL
ncbi:MAG: hypothetical protein LBH22_09200 [Bacteroidales bacterium]|jgi:long-subunit fatty acid transport protein|nr:hypothetical protein [Bacteroidales bacterium]